MGFLTKKKTIVDMQFMELLTPDAAFRQAKFETYFTTNSMRQYNDTMFKWKKDYRGRYKEKYLERAGLEPSSKATRLTVDRVLLLDYIMQLDPTANSITSSSFLIPSLTYIARDHLQGSEYNWSNYTDILTIGSTEYKLEDIDYADPEDDTQIVIYLKNIQDSEDVMEIFFTNEFHAETCLNVRYETSESNTEWYVYIEKKETVPSSVYIVDDMTMTAIIPIKENNQMHEDSLWTKRMLNRLGLGGRSFSDQIEQEENMDNAYIFTGLKFNSESKYMAKALYQTFEYISEIDTIQPEPLEDGTIPKVSSKINFGMSKMNLGYDFDISIETKRGVATRTYSELDQNAKVVYKTELLKPGEYSSALNQLEEKGSVDEEQAADLFTIIESVKENIFTKDTGNNSILKIRYQVSPNTFKEMTISNYINTFTISGYGFTAYLDSSPEDGRLILPLDVMNKLKFKEWIEVHERSFTMLAYSHQVIKIYWYQQSWFSWVIKIGLAFVTGGLSLTWDLLIDLIISYAISMVIDLVLRMIDSEILMVLASVALTALGSMYTSGFDISDFTIENYLPVATKAVQTASNIYQEQLMADIAKLQEKTKEEERQDELMKEEMNSHSFNVTKAMMDAHYSYDSINSPQAWIAQQLGFGLYNYDQYYSVSEQIDLRVQVTSG